MDTTQTLVKLTNPEFDFEFNNKKYTIRKATLDKVVQYYQRAKEIQETGNQFEGIKIVAYCIFLVLKPYEPTLTEQTVLENCPGNIDVVDILIKLGFLNPDRIKEGQTVDQVNPSITPSSS